MCTIWYKPELTLHKSKARIKSDKSKKNRYPDVTDDNLKRAT